MAGSHDDLDQSPEVWVMVSQSDVHFFVIPSISVVGRHEGTLWQVRAVPDAFLLRALFHPWHVDGTVRAED